MSIKIITGHKSNDLTKEVIKSIGDSRLDLQCNNIVVVPDRYSLIVEKEIFKVLNIKATFNIHVMGINDVANELISNAGLNCVYCDRQQSKFLLYRAIEKTKDKFECFSKNISHGFLDKVFNALSLIRPSEITFEQLLQVKSEDVNIEKKMHDLGIILQEYEQLLKSRLDATMVMSVFNKLIQDTTIFQNTNFYFCGFDSFTKQGYEVVKNIAKICKNLTIGAIIPSKNKNNYIFDDEMLKTLCKYFDENKLEYEIKETNLQLTFGQKLLYDNVYSYDINFIENNYYSIFELPNQIEEINYVAKQICYLVKRDVCKFNDICVVTSKNYFKDIEKVFEKYGITYNVDENENLYNTTFSSFLRYIFDFNIQKYEKESFLNLLNNYFFDCISIEEKNNLENEVIENKLEYKKLENHLNEFYPNLYNTLKKYHLKDNADVKYYLNFISSILQENINEKLENIAMKFSQENLHIQKTYIQLYDKFCDLNDKILQVLSEEEISITDFYDLYFNILKEITISQVPLCVDGVFVGDASSSFFENTKYQFIIGCSANNLPYSIKDVGLVTDDDIENVKLSISPTVKMINRRNKFKLFDLLSNASAHLYLTYPLQDEEGKKCSCSTFILDLLKLNNNKKFTIDDFVYNNDFEMIKFNNPTKLVALNNITHKNGEIIRGAIDDVDIFIPTEKNKINSGKTLIKDNKTKISQIECYYQCPFKHFAQYGLKLVKRKTGNLESNDFGNFLHEFAKIFVNKTKHELGEMTNIKVESMSQEIFNSLIEKKEYKLLNDEDNDMVKQIMFDEVTRFANFLNFEQSITKFKIDKTEFPFGYNDDGIKISVNKEKYTIIGVVDRIDIDQNKAFRIIDYKTGSLSGSNAKICNLYYGTKIQVYVYLKAIENKLKLIPFGAFYLPISNAFSTEENEDYKMHGYFLDRVDLVQDADPNISFNTPKSKFIEAEISTKKSNIFNNIKSFIYSKNINYDEMRGMVDYAIKSVENALQDILKGNTQISPFDQTCKYCDYKNICGIETFDIDERKPVLKISPNTFLEVRDE